MGKTGWIILLVLLFLLFRSGTLNNLVGPTQRQPGYNPLYGPPPGPNYSTSPPGSTASQVTDVINHLISAGTDIYRGISGSPSASNPGGGGSVNWGTYQPNTVDAAD